jgi:hypothetical protein
MSRVISFEVAAADSDSDENHASVGPAAHSSTYEHNAEEVSSRPRKRDRSGLPDDFVTRVLESGQFEDVLFKLVLVN